MAKPPTITGSDSYRPRPIQDAEWEEVETELPLQREETFAESLWADLKRIAKTVAIAAGILIVIAFGIGIASQTSSVPEEAATLATPRTADSGTLNEASNASEQTAQNSAQDDWQPSMLCADEQIMGELVNARRQWLLELLTQMAEEGSYILPPDGNPIAEGVAQARISFPQGNSFLSAKETNGDQENDLLLVECQGAMEVRDAFKQADGNKSPFYLMVPKARFDIRSGKNGFTLEFPDQPGELSRAYMHVPGGRLKLQRMREIAVTYQAGN